MIQGLIVLFVGADVLILYVWNTRRRLRARARERNRVSAVAGRLDSPLVERLRDARAGGVAGIVARRLRVPRRAPAGDARSLVYPVIIGIAAAAVGLGAALARQAATRVGCGRRRPDRDRARHPRDALEHRRT